MIAASAAPVSNFDPCAEAFLADPFAACAALRDAGPVVRLERPAVGRWRGTGK